MKEHLKPQNLKSEVMDQISSGKVAATPKWIVLAKIFLVIFGFMIIFGLAMFAGSFLFYRLREEASFGAVFNLSRELRSYISASLLLSFLLGIGLILLILRKGRLGYKTPLLWLIILMLTVSATSILVLDRVKFHDAMFASSIKSGKPGVGAKVYHKLSRQNSDTRVIGRVVKMQDQKIYIHDRKSWRPQPILVEPSEEIIFLSAIDNISIGDIVEALGQYEENTFRAQKIQKLRQFNPNSLILP